MALDAVAGDGEHLCPPAGMRGLPGPLFLLVRDQRIAFLIVGGVNTAIGTAWFGLFLWLWPSGIVGYLGALCCAHILAVLCAFVMYRRFVFRVGGHLWRDLGRFELVNLSTLVYNLAALPLLVEGCGCPPLLSQLIVTGTTVIYSWFAHRGFSFRRNASEPDARHNAAL